MDNRALQIINTRLTKIERLLYSLMPRNMIQFQDWLELMRNLFPMDQLDALVISKEIDILIATLRDLYNSISFGQRITGLAIVPLAKVNVDYISMLRRNNSSFYCFSTDGSVSAYNCTYKTSNIVFSFDESSDEWTMTFSTIEKYRKGMKLFVNNKSGKMKRIKLSKFKRVSSAVNQSKLLSDTVNFKNLVMHLGTKTTVVSSRKLLMCVYFQEGKMNFIMLNINLSNGIYTLSELFSSVIDDPDDIFINLLTNFNSIYYPVKYDASVINREKFKFEYLNTILIDLQNRASAIATSIVYTEDVLDNESIKPSDINTLSEIFRLDKNSATVQVVNGNWQGNAQFSLSKLTTQTGFAGDKVVNAINFVWSARSHIFSILRANQDNLGSFDNIEIKYSLTAGPESYGYNSSDQYLIEGAAKSIQTFELDVVYGGKNYKKIVNVSIYTNVTDSSPSKFYIREANSTIYDIIPYLYVNSVTSDASGSFSGNYYIQGLRTNKWMSEGNVYDVTLDLIANFDTILSVEILFPELLAVSNQGASLTLSISNGSTTNTVVVDLQREEIISNGVVAMALSGQKIIAKGNWGFRHSTEVDNFLGKITNSLATDIYELDTKGSYEIGVVDGIKVYDNQGGAYTDVLNYASSPSPKASAFNGIGYGYLLGNISNVSTSTSMVYAGPSGFLLMSNEEYTYHGPTFKPEDFFLNQNFKGELNFGTLNIKKPETTPTNPVTYSYDSINYTSFVSSFDFSEPPSIFYNFDGNYIAIPSTPVNYTVSTMTLSGNLLLAPDGYTTSYDVSKALANLYDTVTILINSNSELKTRLTNVEDRLNAVIDTVNSLIARINSLIAGLNKSEGTNWFVAILGLTSEILSALFPEFAPFIMAGVSIIDGIYNIANDAISEGVTDIAVGLFGLILAGYTYNTDKSKELAGEWNEIPEVSDKSGKLNELTSGKIINVRNGACTTTSSLADNLNEDLNQNLDTPTYKAIYGRDKVVLKDDDFSYEQNVLGPLCSTDAGYAKIKYEVTYDDGVLDMETSPLTIAVTDGTGNGSYTIDQIDAVLLRETLGLSSDNLVDIDGWRGALNMNCLTQDPICSVRINMDQSFIPIVCSVITSQFMSKNLSSRRKIVRKTNRTSSSSLTSNVNIKIDNKLNASTKLDNLIILVLCVDAYRNKSIKSGTEESRFICNEIVKCLAVAPKVAFGSWVIQ